MLNNYKNAVIKEIRVRKSLDYPQLISSLVIELETGEELCATVLEGCIYFASNKEADNKSLL